jgi:3-dehydroquinate dehydratase
VLGGYLTFASLKKEKSSAPGQLTVENLKMIWKLLHLTDSSPESP